MAEPSEDSEFAPRILQAGAPLWFPDPRLADGEGLVAVGGDLSRDRLLHAYQHGVFPWYDLGLPAFWWSPNPRCILPASKLHISRSLAKKLRRGGFELSWNRDFAAVIKACGENRDEGTWIIPEMIEAYVDLHAEGHAHSLEVWIEGELIAGLYGVQCGGLFAAESMFTRASDMSKIAVVAAVRSLHVAGMRIFDVQFQTAHLASMGAVEWSREGYLERLKDAVLLRVDLSEIEPCWQP